MVCLLVCFAWSANGFALVSVVASSSSLKVIDGLSSYAFAWSANGFALVSVVASSSSSLKVIDGLSSVTSCCASGLFSNLVV